MSLNGTVDVAVAEARRSPRKLSDKQACADLEFAAAFYTHLTVYILIVCITVYIFGMSVILRSYKLCYILFVVTSRITDIPNRSGTASNSYIVDLQVYCR